MKRKARLRRRRATRPSRGTIRKKKPSRGESSKPVVALKKPTYFSLLADVEHALKVEHTEGASLQKLKRDLEQKYGVRKFDVASNKMFNSAVKRLRNRGRVAKIHPNSSLFKFKPPAVPNYNLFGVRSPFRLPSPVGRQLQKPATHLMAGDLPKRSMSMSRSMTTLSRSRSRSGTGSRSLSRSLSRSMSRSIRGSMSSRSMSRSPNSVGKPPAAMSRARFRKPTSCGKGSRQPIRRRRYY